MKSMEKDEKEHPLKTAILIVDDEIMLRNFLQVGLENFGFECSVASNGLEALGVHGFPPSIQGFPRFGKSHSGTC